jgi:aromatic ring-opening dioxygenase catalytic subunit (LigB family)
MSQARGSEMSRREMMGATAGLAGGAFLGAACAEPSVTGTDASASSRDGVVRGATGPRMPAIFLPHGGGPWPWVDLGLDPREKSEMQGYLEGLGKGLPAKPRALLVISAHWEQKQPTLMVHPNPPMLYDYYGFPKDSYEVRWPAPGGPDLAPRAAELLRQAGFATSSDAERGFDHGTFVPLKLAWPEADVPTLQLSLKVGLDPAEHLAMGRALLPLRDDGILIIGSGMSYHNMKGFFDPKENPASEEFDAWLRDAGMAERSLRDKSLAQWDKAPAARRAHPREEHLLPLMVIAGAAGADRATIPYRGTYSGKRLSAYHYG